MEIVPVIDLMRGLVVRGVGGRRDEYRPVESLLAADARSGTIGAAFHRCGFRTTYVADLDAIGGAEPAWSIYEQLLGCGLKLWVDAGLGTPDQVRQLAEFRAPGGGTISAVIVGLESLASPESLARICESTGPERLIFSLDMKAGAPLTSAAAWQGLSAQQIARLALRLGIRRMIVLDLAQVGMGAGVGSEPFCRVLRCSAPHLQIISGGGVRGIADLRSLRRAGCDAALVASALHDGRLSADAWPRSNARAGGMRL